MDRNPLADHTVVDPEFHFDVPVSARGALLLAIAVALALLAALLVGRPL